MGRGEAELIALDEVERSGITPDLPAGSDNRPPADVDLILHSSGIDFNYGDYRREDVDEFNRTVRHPSGAQTKRYGDTWPGQTLAYIAAWKLRDQGGTLEQAEQLWQRLVPMLRPSGFNSSIEQLGFWSGWDERGEGRNCTRRWRLLGTANENH